MCPSIGLIVMFLWVAPALLLQGRAPTEAGFHVGVAPPDLRTWIICFLFWAVVGGLLYLWTRRRVTHAAPVRHLERGDTTANKNHWIEPRTAMNAQTEFETWLALPMVARFRR